jgi:hypothetical protein
MDSEDQSTHHAPHVRFYDVRSFDGAVLCLDERSQEANSGAENSTPIAETYEMGDFLGGGAAANVYAASNRATGAVSAGMVTELGGILARQFLRQLLRGRIAPVCTPTTVCFAECGCKDTSSDRIPCSPSGVPSSLHCCVPGGRLDQHYPFRTASAYSEQCLVATRHC